MTHLTPSREALLRQARKDVWLYARFSPTTAARLEALGYDVGALETRYINEA